jgi:rhodanese-related sulfurtransferase/predicted peroxiredoxin
VDFHPLIMPGCAVFYSIMKCPYLPTIAVVLGLLSTSAVTAVGVDASGLSAQEAHRLLAEKGGEILFLDVRDPVEIQFVGQPAGIDANVPYLLVDRRVWNPERGMLLLRRNAGFVQGVEAALATKGLGRDAEIITICRSGSERGMPSSVFLRHAGFPNAHYVIHGFQGDALEEGTQKGMRLKNGWQNDGLPWEPRPILETLALEADARAKLFILSSASPETQAMTFVLASATLDMGEPVRILLCDEAGKLALLQRDEDGRTILPPGKTPRELLQGLIARGALVEVCGIFLPTRQLDASALAYGITPANPRDIAVALSESGAPAMAQ